jgi:hypothetical protein
MKKIAILHYQPLEKYPPIMNFIHNLEIKNINCKVFTTNSQINWFNSKFNIHRFGSFSTNTVVRYWTHINYNLVTFLQLLFYKPTKIIYYETYSSLPVYWYKRLFKVTPIFIHFHEYISPVEKQDSSYYVKCLLKREAYLLKNANWISQTNKERMELFQKDYPFLSQSVCHIFPNYPPANWQNLAQTNKTDRSQTTYQKIIYIGALGMKSTYIEVFAKWIHQQKGAYYFDIFSDNMEKEVMEMIAALKSPFISIKQPINYFDLPSILANYDIGVVLYTGHIPNYVYNVPNKVFEYLVCGLDVWYSKDLISTAKFQQDNKIENLKAVCFKDPVIMEENKINQVPFYYSFSCEAIYANILNDL